MIVFLFVRNNIYVIYSMLVVMLSISLIYKAYILIAHYKLYSRYSKNKVIMIIFDILTFALLGPLFIFAIRDNEEIK